MRIKTGEPIDPALFGFPSGGDNTPVTAIATHSGEIRPGDLFLALQGEKTDGAVHIGEAYANGAARVLSHRSDGDPRTLTVQDPLAVLFSAAALYASAIPHKTVAVTGSYGKTTLRTNLTAILSTVCRVCYTEGNGNTDLAVALTMLSIQPGTEVLVAELGMRGPGEIGRLSRLVRPDVAVITGIGSAHIGLLGSKAGICRAKCEIADGMTPDGVLLYPAGDPLLAAAVPELGVRARSVSVDPAVPAFYSLAVKEVSEGKPLVTLSSPTDTLDGVRLSGDEAPILSSAAFCFAVCSELGIERAVIRDGLTKIKAAPLRGQTEEIGGVTVLLDCYNASPEPTEAALASLNKNGRRVFLVLGDMLELGDAADALHQMIGRRAAALDPARLYCVGDFAKGYAVGAFDAGLSREKIALFVPDELQVLSARLKQELAPGDLVFVKGSRALALERIVHYLKQAES